MKKPTRGRGEKSASREVGGVWANRETTNSSVLPNFRLVSKIPRGRGGGLFVNIGKSKFGWDSDASVRGKLYRIESLVYLAGRTTRGEQRDFGKAGTVLPKEPR